MRWRRGPPGPNTEVKMVDDFVRRIYQGLLCFTCMQVVFVPWVVYFSIKLGTYAFYAGRRRFHKDHPNKKEIPHENEES